MLSPGGSRPLGSPARSRRTGRLPERHRLLDRTTVLPQSRPDGHTASGHDSFRDLSASNRTTPSGASGSAVCRASAWARRGSAAPPPRNELIVVQACAGEVRLLARGRAFVVLEVLGDKVGHEGQSALERTALSVQRVRPRIPICAAASCAVVRVRSSRSAMTSRPAGRVSPGTTLPRLSIVIASLGDLLSRGQPVPPSSSRRRRSRRWRKASR